MEEGEQPDEDEEQDADAGAESDDSQWSDAGGYEAEDWSGEVAAFPEDEELPGCGNKEMVDTLVPVSAEAAELVMKSTKLMETYAAVAAELERVGAVALAANVVREQRREARRMRTISALDTGVLVALNRDRDAEAAVERKRLRLVEEVREKRQCLSETKAKLREAENIEGQKESPF